MPEENKTVELKDNELNMVVGGLSQNSDGTYNVYVGDIFRYANIVIVAQETKLNVTLDTNINCEYCMEDENGDLKDFGRCIHTVGELLYIMENHHL